MSRPPWLASAVLSMLLPPALRDEVMGDLAEEYEARRGSDGHAQARRWYRRQCTAVGARILGERLQRVSGRSKRTSPPDGGSRHQNPFGGLALDVRQAARWMRATPGATLAAVVTLVLALGSGAVLGSAIHALLVAPFPYPDFQQLVWIDRSSDAGFARFDYSGAELRVLASQDELFEGVAGATIRSANLTGGGHPERLRLAPFSPGLFDVLGVRPAHGRAPTRLEHEQEARVIVLAWTFWQQRLSGREDVLGETLLLDGRPHSVIGVMPERVVYGGADGWVPVPLALGHDGPRLVAVARARRLPEGELHARLARTGAALDAVAPAPADEPRLALRPVAEAVLGRIRPALILLASAVGLVLVLAVANVANLLLARASARQRELAVRLALGASRARLLRLAIIEASLIAAAGWFGGMLFAWWGMDVLEAVIPARYVPAEARGQVTLNAWGLGTAAVAAGVAALAAAVATSASVVGAERVTPQLRSGRGETDRTGQRLRALLILVETAVAVAVLASAAVVARSLGALEERTWGFEPNNVITFRLALPDSEPQPAPAVFASLAERLRQLPDVQEAAVATRRPLRRVDVTRIRIPGRGDDRLSVAWRAVDAGYFDVLRVPVRAGRVFTRGDRAESGAVAILNRTLARTLWPDADPVGRVLQLDAGDDAGAILTIVGIVEDVPQFGVDGTVGPELFRPASQAGGRDMAVLLRARGDPLRVVGAARAVVSEAVPGVPIYDVLPLESRVAESLAPYRLSAALLGALAAVGVMLALVGIYGVVSFAVERRNREIGIRLAFGAPRRAVARLIVWSAAQPVAMGALAGVAVVLGGTGLLSGLMYGVAPTDAATLLTIAGGFCLSAVVFTWIPLRRATRIDPVEVLRQE